MKSDLKSPDTMKSVLPVIAFDAFAKGTPTGRRQIAGQIHEAVLNTGFFHLDGHGMDAPLATAMSAADWFFDLPETDKQAIAIEKSPCHRGWYAIGGERLDAVTYPEGDFKEDKNRSRPGPLTPFGRHRPAAAWPKSMAHGGYRPGARLPGPHVQHLPCRPSMMDSVMSPGP